MAFVNRILPETLGVVDMGPGAADWVEPCGIRTGVPACARARDDRAHLVAHSPLSSPCLRMPRTVLPGSDASSACEA